MMLHPDHEWSLIIFNILGQMSVGAFLALGIAHFYAVRKAGLRHADLLSTRALLALGPVLVLGMLAVFGHVGNPERALNMLSNLDTSWLAREVAAYGAFLVVGGAFAVLQALTFFRPDETLPVSATVKAALPKVRIALAWIAAVFGILFVLSAAMIYYDPRLAARQTGWAHPQTLIMFFVDMGLMGVLALGVGFVTNYLWVQRRGTLEAEDMQIQTGLLRDSIKGLSFAAVALIGVFFVSIPIYLVYLGAEGGTLTQAIVTMLYTDFATLFFLRLFLAFTGAGILAVFAWYTAMQERRQTLMYLLVVGAFVCAIVAEVIGRYLFYGRNATMLIGGP
ncbi:MAG: dimethyl sulfoxide reductase anchor subunit [Anaerolineae bacterium]|nr:dimethyl sulfoxide reductase anchor subunit [Anaerolineae bacterium]